MLGKYAKTSQLIGSRVLDAQNFGFQTPKKANSVSNQLFKYGNQIWLSDHIIVEVICLVIRFFSYTYVLIKYISSYQAIYIF
jgi:hypothetical protein